MKKTSRRKTTPLKATPRDMAKQIAQAAFDKKGLDIAVMDLTSLSSLTDYFVLASGSSTIQAQAIAKNVQESMLELKMKPFSAEGAEHGNWILLDYGSVVAHIFCDEVRAFYGLEDLWSDAKKVNFRLT